jgi:Arc/MetJ-type ribon-helix-helix transcriptional regulator
LYRAARIRAAESSRQIRDVIEEALREWLERQEDAEDIQASKQALAEYEAQGGEDADTFFRRMVAEGRVTYDAGD